MMVRILPQLLLGLAVAALPVEPLLVGPCACGLGRFRVESARPVHPCCRVKAASCCTGHICCCRMGMDSHASGGYGLRCNCRGNARQPVPTTNGSQAQVTLALALVGPATLMLPPQASRRGIEVASRATPLERCSVLCRFLI